MEILLRDLRLAFRSLLKNRGFTFAALLCLALGIGASSAIFSVVNTVLLKPLPFAEPDRLVRLGTSMRALGMAPEVNALDARDWTDQSRGLEVIGLYDVENVTLHLDGTDAPLSASSLLADAGLSRVLGIQPFLGRGFVDDDFHPGAAPVVVLAHIPLWTVWERWGWGTADSAQAMALLRPFGSVTVLNGHIHQVLQKVEGNVALHTAMSLAYPLPTPGQEGIGEPGPVTVPAGELGKLLGTRRINVMRGKHQLALIDTPLERA